MNLSVDRVLALGFLLDVGCSSPASTVDGSSGVTEGSASETTETQSDESEATAGTADSSTGAVPAQCTPDLPGGGEHAGLAGTGISTELPVVVDETVTLEDLGASITFRVLWAEPTEPSSFTLRTLTEPLSMPDRFVLGPVFELAPPEGFTPNAYPLAFSIDDFQPPADLVGLCSVGILDADTLEMINPEFALVPEGTTRLVLVSLCAETTCGGECTNGLEDAHCGGCDPCDAACSAGVCVGEAVGEAHAHALHSDGTGVWWRPWDEDYSIQRGSTSTGVVERYAGAPGHTCTDLATGMGAAYWIDAAVESTIYGMGIEDEAQVLEVFAEGELVPLQVAADADDLAVLAVDDMDAMHLLTRPLDAGALVEIDGCPGGPLLPYVLDLVVDGGDAFVFGPDTGAFHYALWKCPLDGSPGIMLHTGADSDAAAGRIIVEGEDVWFGTSNGTIRRVPRGGGDALAMAEARDSSFAVDVGILYLSTGGEFSGDLLRVDAQGEQLLIADEVAAGIAVADGTLYWTANDLRAHALSDFPE